MPDLLTLGAEVEWTDGAAATVAQNRAGPQAGRLAELAGWLAAVQGTARPVAPARVRLAVVGAVPDDAVLSLAAADGAQPAGVAPDRGGDDAGVATGLAEGMAAADRAVDEGSDLLVLAGRDRGPAPAAVVGLVSGVEPVALLPRGAAAVDTAAWITRAAHLRDVRRRIAGLRGDPEALLTALDSPVLAAATGLLLRAVARRTPVVLDGALALAAALLCGDVQPRCGRWWRVADRADEDPVSAHALDELVQAPVLALGTTRGDGLAGLLAARVLTAAVLLTESAGVGDG